MPEKIEKIASVAITDDTRTEARLCAIQAQYQHSLEVAESGFEGILNEFMSNAVRSRKADKKLFRKLFESVSTEKSRLQIMVEKYLKEGWKFPDLDKTMQALLLVATAEFSTCPDTPTSVIINEYLTLTRAFFDESQVPFVNALLDNIAKELR